MVTRPGEEISNTGVTSRYRQLQDSQDQGKVSNLYNEVMITDGITQEGLGARNTHLRLR